MSAPGGSALKEAPPEVQNTAPIAKKRSGAVPETWFPAPVWARRVPDHERIDTHILSILDELETNGRAIKRSNVGGWHSAANLHANDDLAEIRRIIGGACAGCATHLSFDFDHFELFFQEMWLNKNGPGDFNKAHVHPNSMLSGAYYAKVPPQSGNIEFYDPVRERVMSTFPVKERTRSNVQAMEYRGREGLLLIFPGWLQHSVQPNRSNDFRVSISFNMGFRRKGA
ncbi:MAG: 2OG-Fe(II) oxygenase family protein [Parvibaculum sp.]|nr:2OG-Fe(II) oxygenase family protein [Parvibaculum sp.]